MRVLLTADAVGGVFTYAAELARALALGGDDVALATTGRRLSPDQRAELARVPRLQLFESAWMLEWMEEPWGDVARTAEWLLGVAARVRPDVVHLDEFAHGALPFAAPRLVVGHSCVLSWFEAVRGTPAPPSFDRYRAVVRRGLAGADLVVAPTRAALAALERHHGPLRRARVIPNGRDPARFAPAAVKEPFVLCAARLWDEAKGARALDAIAAELPWPVYLAGEEAHPDPAHAGLAGAPACRSLGRLAPEALAGWYARAAIYALPARYEPFGLSALEAALSGCALVVGDLASLRESWEGAARFVAPGDRAALRAAIAELCADRPLREELGARALRRGRTLGPARMAAAYREAYASLLGPAAEGLEPCAS
jgi:glycosyltransferase involved in cell wall biosynthesis